MNSDSWDPLERALPAEIVSATLKRQIKNILKSYTGWYDPFSELIQNSLDGLDEYSRNNSSFKPEIWIKIDLQNNLICVTDNGIGLPKDKFESFLAPNVSFKNYNNRGNKGVGATFLAYGFNYLQVGTKCEGYNFVGTIREGREWVEDEGGIKTRPKVQKDVLIHEVFKALEHGTTSCLKLIGQFIRPRNLQWVGANTAEQWDIILRIKTPLGGIYMDRDYKSPVCHIEVIDENGNATTKDIIECQYIYPHSVIGSCKSLGDIFGSQKRLIEERKDPSRLPAHYYNLNGIYAYWSFGDIESGEFKAQLDDTMKTLAKQYNMTFYAFLCYTTDIWDKFNDETVKLRKGTRILHGGLQLSANTMPQGELLTIPLKRNIGYQNVAHVIVHFRDADPDLGRKGFQPELVDLANNISTAAVNSLIDMRRYLKSETGAAPDIESNRSIHDWIREQEKHESEHPLIIERQDIFLPLKHAAITSLPLNEQDVIALFNQLLAGGVIRGIKILATSQHAQYDGIFRFSLKKPFEVHKFDKNSNPLGLEDIALREIESAPMILEYKYSFDALIEEFEKETKREDQIKLVVAWIMGSNWKRRYEVTPLLYLENVHNRYFHGGTHIIKRHGTGESVFPMIILSELIDFINGPDKCQDYQKKVYIF